MTEYNGYTNRETWLVDMYFKIETLDDWTLAKLEIEEIKTNIKDRFLSDYVNFSKIDWQNLKPK